MSNNKSKHSSKRKTVKKEKGNSNKQTVRAKEMHDQDIYNKQRQITNITERLNELESHRHGLEMKGSKMDAVEYYDKLFPKISDIEKEITELSNKRIKFRTEHDKMLEDRKKQYPIKYYPLKGYPSYPYLIESE